MLLPVVWVAGAGSRALGGIEVDLVGHIWTIWHATQEPLTRTELIGYPDGVDLMPILGGWADIWLASKLAPLVGLVPAFNMVTGLYLMLAGVGGHLLARTLGASALGGLVAGTLLQLEPYMLHHLHGGRTEQLAVGPVALVIVALFVGVVLMLLDSDRSFPIRLKSTPSGNTMGNR